MNRVLCVVLLAMAMANRTEEQVRQDMIDIFGEDLTPAPSSSSSYPATELRQIEELTEAEPTGEINSDEEFLDVNDDISE